MLSPLEFDSIYDLVNEALDEDLGRGDITSRAVVRQGQKARGSFTAKQELVLAGLEVADAVFGSFDYTFQIESASSDGELLPAGKVFARISGDAQVLLSAERVALNFLQHLSGIATLTRTLRRCDLRDKSRDRRYPQDDSGASRTSEICSLSRWRTKSPDGA